MLRHPLEKFGARFAALEVMFVRDHIGEPVCLSLDKARRGGSPQSRFVYCNAGEAQERGRELLELTAGILEPRLKLDRAPVGTSAQVLCDDPLFLFFPMFQPEKTYDAEK